MIKPLGRQRLIHNAADLQQKTSMSLKPYGLVIRGIRRASTDLRGVAKPNKKERVAVLGSGWAGYGFARTLDPSKFERIVISPRSYFVFTPLLAGTAVGTLEFRAVLESVRRLGLDAFHQGWADDIDFTRKTIRIEANTSDDLTSRGMDQHDSGKKGEMFNIEYDKLVIAVGSYSQTFGIEGVREYANFLRDVGDARKIRLKVLQCFEKAALPTTTDEERKKLLHFAVVGGGPTGIEFAAELHDLYRDDIGKLYPGLREFVTITVYDIAPKVLPMFDQSLAKYAMDTFMREGIRVKTKHSLQRIRPNPDCEGCLKLKIKQYGDEEIDAGIVVWSTGLMQNPLVKKLGQKVFQDPLSEAEATSSSEYMLHRDPKTGSIFTNGHLQVHMVPQDVEYGVFPSDKSVPMPGVYAIGDCAQINGHILPATAQVASQKATHLAKHLNKGDAGTTEFKFKNWGTMTYLGNWKAIHQSQADDLKGWAAWVLWRTAYLTKSMSIRNKIMVPIYWAISWMFGRDISRF